MKTSEVARLLGISPNTVRTWTWREFRSYFSPAAQGGDGTTRSFTDLDIQVMSHIAALSRKNVEREAIHAELQRLQANGWRDLPPMAPVQTTAMTVPVIPTEAAQRELDAELKAAAREAFVLREQIAKLEDGRNDDRQTILELERRLARAELKLELYESGELKPKG